ncbi:DUF2254 domain-containing protein [haloarchaeon 3A1-DGR]|nr:DUF2254 domain-containing protein [haloarchaeon 3A1-DGR]
MRFQRPAITISAVALGISLVAADLTPSGYFESPDQVLTTLATVQSAIFAIVFSVVILGVQLSTSRYSSRLADLFRSDQYYRVTVGIFGISIGLSVFTLVFRNSLNGYLLRFAVVLAAGFAVTSFIILFYFVDSVLDQTTPEGIIQRVDQELTPEKIIEQATLAGENNAEPDPFLIPNSIVRSAVDDMDLAAASLGLSTISRRVEELLTTVSTDDIEDDSPLGQSIQTLCTKRLPNLTETAAEDEFIEAGSESIQTISSIGTAGIREELEVVSNDSLRGITRLIAELEFDPSSEKLRKESVDEACNIADTAAESGLWDTAGTGIRYVGFYSATSIMRRGASDRNQRAYTNLSISRIPSLFSELMENLPDEIETDAFQNRIIRRHGDYTSSSEVWALWCCYASMAETTSAYLRYELEHEEPIVDWSMVSSGWSECVSTASESGFDYFTYQWLGTLFYLEYLSRQGPESFMANFNPTIQYRIRSEVVENTVDRVRSGSVSVRNRIDLLPGHIDPIETPLTGYSNPPFDDIEEEFERWLDLKKGMSRRFGMGGAPQKDAENSNTDE